MVTETELDTLRQTYEISLRQMRTFLDAQARMLDVTEDEAAEAREEIERIAEALSPGMVDEKRKASPAGTSQMTNRQLADAIIRHVKSRLRRLQAAQRGNRDADKTRGQLEAENTRLREHVTRLERELAERERLVRQEQARSATFQQALEDAHRRLGLIPGAPKPGEEGSAPGQSILPPERLPEWMQKWRREQTHERDLGLLRVLAETGVARRADAAQLFGAQEGVDPEAGSVARAFSRCSKLGLIELVEARSGTSGSSIHHLVLLTEQGRDACRLLLGLEPVPSQTAELLARHKSPEHALLNLEAADLLREAGYAVDLFPGQVRLPGEPYERTFAPDLSASLHGRTIFVEVERGVGGGVGERDRKWRNYYQATGGEFYVIVPDHKAMEAVRGEIQYWANREKLVLWMSSISDVRGKGKQGDEIWTFKRGQPG
jgi:hypothetical protein